MSELDNDPLDEVTRQALDWVTRLKTGDPKQSDLDACRAWRAQSPEHETRFREAARLWSQLRIAAAELREEEATRRAPEPVIASPLSAARYLLGRRAFLSGAVATSVAAYMVVRPPFELWPSLAELRADYRTAKGEQRRVDLGGGATMEMNTQTSIRLKALAGGLEIDLISGEALVETRAAPDNPLVLRAGDGFISSYDAARFNVRCLDEQVEVTCLQGTVNVEQNQQSVRIQAHQEITYTDQGLGVLTAADPADRTSWQNKSLIFRNRPLYEVVKEVNRYLPGRIVVTNAALGKKVVNGTFQIDRLNDVIGQVQQLFGAHVISLPGGLTLLS
ncbi:FecR family protein [Methyloferula stellata]|uniref:FecR family protein n=1 Tax=Methyloferula stellata TaxID=876270 RepID=UPI0003712325|nr:FecR domain-containing protein [Methyloferula stellata]